MSKGCHLRPFFCLYGGKARAAKRYPPPERGLIVEPFAGAAGFSLYHGCGRDVVLVERDPLIAGVWRYLLTATPAEILDIPDLPKSGRPDDLALPAGPTLLMRWWLNEASSGPRRTLVRRGRPGGARYGSSAYWGSAVRKRIAEQLPHIRHWQLIEGDYTDAPDLDATWFIDPPYQGAGKYYRFGDSRINYAALGQWCKTRTGQVIVCENGGAEWLPFSPLYELRGSSMQGKRSTVEAVWTRSTD